MVPVGEKPGGPERDERQVGPCGTRPELRPGT